MSTPNLSVVIFSSSSEIGLDIATKLEGQLSAMAKCSVWNEAMQPGCAISGELQRLLDTADFAICVLTGDRDSSQPGKHLPSENVVFESGLCTGSLGRERTFLLCHGDQHRNLPADLGGIIYLQHKPGDDVSKVCKQISSAINKQGRRVRQPRLFCQVNDAFKEIRERLGRGLDVDKVELIQHSSVRASVLVGELIGRHLNIDMFLQHPDVTERFSLHGANRTQGQIVAYKNQYLRDGKYRGCFRIYYYKTPAAFNGVRIRLKEGRNLYFVSWYTYDAVGDPLWTEENGKEKATGITLTGGESACIEVDDGIPESVAINRLFDRQIQSAKRECPKAVFECRSGKVLRSPAG